MFHRLFDSRLLLALVLLVAAFAAACERKGGVRIGDTAPAIVATDLAGNAVNPARLKGKTVVVYFWTDSCCGDSLKKLGPFYSRHKDKAFEFIAINELDSRQAIASYAARHNLAFTMLSDEGSALFNAFNVMGFPTVLILDRQGVVREKVLGDMQTAKLEKLIERHIN